MTAPEMLSALRECGAAVSVDGDALVIKAPRGALSAELRGALPELKPALIALLGAGPCLPPRHENSEPAYRAAGPCAVCGGTEWGIAWPVGSTEVWWECARCYPADTEDVAGPSHRLPPVHDTDDPWAKPTAPCMVCGQVRWRVWCHDERKVWQWICNGCRPLVVINPDGTRWRS